MRYSGLAFQIALTIFLFARLGLYLDRKSENSKPIYTLILACFGLLGSMVYLIRKVSRDS